MGYVVPQLQGHREKWWLPWVVILGLFVAIAASIPFCQQDHRGEDNWETYSHQLQRLDIGDQFPFPPDPIAHVEVWRKTKDYDEWMVLTRLGFYPSALFICIDKSGRVLSITRSDFQ
jgi:hypothetical protein